MTTKTLPTTTPSSLPRITATGCRYCTDIEIGSAIRPSVEVEAHCRALIEHVYGQARIKSGLDEQVNTLTDMFMDRITSEAQYIVFSITERDPDVELIDANELVQKVIDDELEWMDKDVIRNCSPEMIAKAIKQTREQVTKRSEQNEDIVIDNLTIVQVPA